MREEKNTENGGRNKGIEEKEEEEDAAEARLGRGRGGLRGGRGSNEANEGIIGVVMTEMRIASPVGAGRSRRRWVYGRAW